MERERWLEGQMLSRDGVVEKTPAGPEAEAALRGSGHGG